MINYIRIKINKVLFDLYFKVRIFLFYKDYLKKINNRHIFIIFMKEKIIKNHIILN